MDGAGDERDHTLGLDGGWKSFSGPLSGYGGTKQARTRPIAGQGSPTQASANHFGPPPPLSPQSYLANTLHSLGGTRRPTQPGRQVSPAQSTHWRSQSGAHTGHPPLTFQYGIGPIPHRSRANSAAVNAPSALGGNAQGFDASMLDKLLTKAVNQGAAEIQQEGNSLVGQSVAPTYASHILPGAWPSSPFANTSQPTPFAAGAAMPAGQNSMVSGDLGVHWGAQPAPSKVGTNSGWSQVKPTLPPNEASGAGAWGSGQHNQEPWDSDETWGTKDEDCNRDATRQREHPKSRSGWGIAKSRARSPTVRTTRSRSRRSPKSRHSAKSKMRESVWESGTDKDGWTYVEAQSDSDSSWSATTTVRPSSSISAAIPRALEPSGSAISYNTRAQKTSMWGDVPAIPIPPPPPGFERDGAPGAFMESPKFFRESTSETRRSSAWKEEDSKNRRASSARGKQDWWAATDDDQRSRRAKTIVTLDDRWDDENVHDQPPRTKRRHGSKRVEEGAGDWATKDVPGGDPTAKGGWGSTDNPWKIPEKGSKPKANGWTTEPLKLKQEAHKAGDDWELPDTKPSRRKSRLSHHHKKRPATNTDSTSKPHWKFPPPSSENRNWPSEAYGATLPAEPTYNISKETAEKKGVEHQVRAGKGTKYEHHIGRPEYIDSLEKPVSPTCEFPRTASN